MTPTGVQVDLDIPGKIKIMKKLRNIILVSILLAGIVSCTGGKKITAQKEVSQPVDTAQVQLAEQKQMEFEYLFVEALKQKMLGNPQNAIQILSSCLEIDPNSSAAMYELANIHAANNDFTSSALLLEKAISIDNDNKWYKELLAQIYQQTRKFSEAAEIYDQLLKNDPENLELLYTKAILQTNAKEYDKAIQTYNIMEKETGINEQISVSKQQLYVLNKQPEKAFDEINKLIENNPSEAKYYGLKADLYQSIGDSVKALENYKRILEMDPGSGFVHFSLANYYLEQNKLDESYKETLEGFANSSVDLQTKIQFYMLLVSNKEKSKLTDAQELQLVELLVEKHPDEYLVHTLYADYWLRQKNLENAREQLLKALELEANDYMIWEQVLFIDNDLQEWDSLYQHSLKAIDFFPNQPQVYLLNTVACIQLEKFDKAIEIADEGIDFVVDNPKLKAQFTMLKGEAIIFRWPDAIWTKPSA